MKKLFMILLMALIVSALAACSGDDKGDAADSTDADVTEQTDGTSGDEPNSAVLDNEYFKNVVDILKAEGYELTNFTDGDTDFFTDTQSSFAVQVNGEDMLTLQVFEMDPDSEHLKNAAETGMGQAEFEGEVAEIPVLVIDNHYFFLAEGHPDQEDIYKLLQEKLK
ncbi:hypothetical protein SLU01_01140 [Sporosarcina luteola]|uniref:Lipoprotein n=1 Tax=Sporosarcina luteola TaxID=582850 RepID=A0A511Z2X8_9BACL|nr:hypothetical protein [Sporosarcina luteola]GEN81802.1 hypothetical protein SLU01_01140 [Sporosarcina luteola]